jgi:RHS repeat-associated protein
MSKDTNTSNAATGRFHTPALAAANPQATKPLPGYSSAAVQQTILDHPSTEVSPGFKFDGAKQVFDLYRRPKLSSKGQVANFATNTVAGPSSIAELARALNVDGNGPQLMYEWVYNNCEWEPGWGVQKGALGALLDGMGNSFDQSLLLAALLRQAGFTANIVQGTIRLTEAQFSSWFGTSDIWAAQNYCFNLFIPVVTPPTWTGSTFYMDIKHVWVQWVSTSTYIFDPSLKSYTRTPLRTDLTTILGYNASTLVSDAQAGATVDPAGDFVQNINRTSVRTDLNSYTANLINWIQSNKPDAQMEDLVGGQAIIPAVLPVLQTSLPYEMPGDTPTVWTGDVPSTFKPTLRFQYPNFSSPGVWDIDWSATSEALAASRLTLFYDGGLVPELYLNGTVVGTGLAQPSGSYTSVFLTVQHPAYDASNYPLPAQQFYQTNFQWWQSFIFAGANCLIANAWGNLGNGQLNYHLEQVEINTAAGGLPASESVRGASLAVAYAQWVSQNSRITDIVNRLKLCKTVYSHQIGVVSYIPAYDSTFIDMGGMSGSSDNLNNDVTQTPPNDTVIAMHGVALEAGSLMQITQNRAAVATVRVHDKINRSVNTKFSGTITPGDILTIVVHDLALSGGAKSLSYTIVSGDTLTSIAGNFMTAINGDPALNAIKIDANATGSTLVIASLSENQTTYTSSTSVGATESVSIAFQKLYKGTSSNWNTGSNIASALVANGYSATDISNIYNWYLQYGNTAVIGENPVTKIGQWSGWGEWIFPNNGAFGFCNGTFKVGVNVGPPTVPTEPPKPPRPPKEPTKNDPIGFVSGSFTYERKDFSIGNIDSVQPYKLAFERSYTSAMRFNDGPLGLGWTHNFAGKASLGSNGFLAMGETTANFGVSTIVNLFVALDLISDTARPLVKTVVATIGDAWWIDQIFENIVTVTVGTEYIVFVKLPDGTFAAPLNSNKRLTIVSGMYVVTAPDQTKWNFNSSGALASIVYSSGVTITLTYTSGQLTAVSNNMGRTFTLGYTGNYISSVSDGVRSIQYSIDASKNLVSFTNTLSKTYVYQYDQPGRMVKYFKPANPSLAYITNIYDSLSRIQTQANANGKVWTYYFAGSRSEEIDPVGSSSTAYFDRRGLKIRDIDALGRQTFYKHDGLSRLSESALPEGNKEQWTFDSFNNILTHTFIPKPGSPLSNLVLGYTYDPVFHKPKTYTDAKGGVWTWNYDPATGNTVSLVYPTTSGGTPQETWTYNLRGQPLTFTDRTAIVTKYTYDATTEAILTSVLDFGTSPHLNLTSSYGYNTVGDVTSVTDARSLTVILNIDSERQQIQKTDPSPFGYVTKFSYDDNGNRISMARQMSSTPTWQNSSYSYTPTEKLQQYTDPLSFTQTWSYDDRDLLLTYTDAEGLSWTYTHDGNNQVTSVRDPSGIIAETRNYTNNSFVSSVTDSRGNPVGTTYDGFDRVDKITYADGSYEQNQSYDANGRVLVFRTRSGNTVTMTYDALNRLTTRAPSAQPIVTNGYDLADRLTSVSTPTVAGHPESGNYQFLFDTAGRRYQEITPDSKITLHELDANGNLTKLTYPDGYFVTKTFDQLDRITDVYLNGSAVSAAHFDYDYLSRRTVLTYGNGAVVNYSYSVNDDLVNLVQIFNGSNTLSLGYGFNASHQERRRTISDGSFIWNPSVAGTISYGAASVTNQYPVSGGFSYDANGNLTGDGVWTFSYDTENHLLGATKAGVGLSYYYDGINRQILKTVAAGAKTRFVYDSWQRIADYDGSSGSLQNRYVYAASLDEPLLSVDISGTATYLHGDRQGTIIATTNSSAIVTSTAAFSPYGEGVPANTSFGFTGQRFDADLGLYYYKRRYYSSALGRFLQNDPLGIEGGDLNTYSYVLNDPLNNTDPMGMEIASIGEMVKKLFPPVNSNDDTSPIYGCYVPEPSDPETQETCDPPDVSKPGGVCPITEPKCTDSIKICQITPPKCPTPPKCVNNTTTPPKCPQPPEITPPTCPPPTPPTCPVDVTPPKCKPPKP